MSLSKNRKLALEKYDRDKDYSLDDAIGLIKDMKFSKFDESVDIALNMGVDPRHADQNIRITTSLPSGTGSEVIILVLARGPKEQESKEEGADFIGNDDFIEKLVHVNRITKVVKGGRRFRFSALVVVGNQKGKIGIAHAKAKQVPDAIKKANEIALSLIHIS